MLVLLHGLGVWMKPSRRDMLKSALALAAGALGVGAATRAGGHSTSAGGERSAHTPMTLVGRNLHVVVEGRGAGQGPSPGDRVSTFGEIFDPAGTRLGEFYGSGFYLNAPFDSSGPGAASVELHAFRLGDGTIHGMGTTTPGADEESGFAVVGGTGRFRDLRGTYTALQSPIEHGGDGSAHFTLTFGT